MNRRVLIADDEESIIASLEFLMRKAGYETRVARDGESALACAAEFAPRLIVLDIMLPGRSGFEVCARLRADPRMHDTRVLMLTARSSADDEAHGASVGADAYMTKPFSTQELVSRVRMLMDEATS
jgi:DNA-binding response OmpR family regulator